MKHSFRLAAAALLLSTGLVRAALVDYYTLDTNSVAVGGGRADASGSSLGGGNLATLRGTGTASTTSGIVGGALQFSNTLAYTTGAVNSLPLPLTFSIWVNTNSGLDEVDRAIAISDSGVATRDFGLGIVNPTRQATQVARNGGTPNSSVAPGSINDGNWHLITGVFASAANRLLYLDGKFASSSTISTSLWSANSATVINIGGVLRSSGLVEAFNGALDEAGVFNTALTDADVALINGLGQTAAFGLDQLDEAQDLNASAVGSTATIGGLPWFKVDGLVGETGDYGGNTQTGDAYIITDGATGAGITTAPEPHSLALLACAAIACGARRMRATKSVQG
jgi:hypothetical protein